MATSLPSTEVTPEAIRSGAAVALHEVSKIYGTFAALRNVSAVIAPGSCTVILGENGAGKSTLLRVIAGLITPTRGTVEVLGLAPGEARGQIAYMSHAPMLYDELTATENLDYFANLHRQTGDCGCTGSPEMSLRAVGLDPNLKRTVGQYSQGMRQRTSLARVLQSDPELLLLDEPFSNLDVASAKGMVDLLADFRTWPLTNGRKRSVLITTHQAALALPIADNVLTMAEGRIVSHGAPA